VVFALGFVLLIAGAGLTYLTINYITGPGQFVARNLVINNTVFADNEQIQTAVVETCGGNMLMVDLAEVCKAVERIPWVSEVKAAKILPDTLQLDIIESVPKAFAIIDSVMYLVDERGRIIDRLQPEYPYTDLPVICGLDGLDEEILSDRLSLGSNVLRDIMMHRPDWHQRISDVDVSDPKALSITLRGIEGPIITGDRNILTRLAKYFLIEASLQQRYDSVLYFDARYDRRLFVKTAGD
jgi:cell division septal protein FtsQ